MQIKLQKQILTILLFIASLSGFSQNNTLRIKTFYIKSDTILLDSLSIVPGSEIIYNSVKEIIPASVYTINYEKSLLYFLPGRVPDSDYIQVTYRVFPLNFTSIYAHRKLDETIVVGPVLVRPAANSTTRQSTFLTDNQLDKRGSIARGITLGNNQDATISSTLNMQLSGKLSNDMYILAALSDENIPIQPDGNSQQIQDFDKVFIQLYNQKTKLIAGDFEITSPQGYFLKVNRKAQGGILNTKISGKKKPETSFETTIGGAVSKGKYCRKTFPGQEGNQGPYKLTGCENEQFIVILAGSEKVYINGQLMKRAKELDYTIDYNTGEITFTANRLITKDSRIVIEFEYTERSYARFMIYSSNTLKTKHGDFWLNIYSEQDSKNQPINEDLTPEQKQLLYDTGDQINNAFVLNADSVAFQNDIVLYTLIDSVVNGNTYSIYKYSTDPDKAFYQVGFNYVGANKGNYIPAPGAANGKVYQWVAPAGGVLQGSYEPVRLLVTPKKQQMLSLGGDLVINPYTDVNYEFALSNNDINTFSDKDDSDNIGYALTLNLSKSVLKADTIKNLLKTQFTYQLTDQKFKETERFRDVEFERDWNLEQQIIKTLHFFKAGLLYAYKTQFTGNYRYEMLSSNPDYNANRNYLGFQLNKNNYLFRFNGSYLSTDSKLNQTQFARYQATLSKSFKIIRIGLKTEMENNIRENLKNDSLLLSSFGFNAYTVFIENPDTFVNKYNLSYTLRNDFLPLGRTLENSSQSEDLQIGFGLFKNPDNLLKTQFNLRTLKVYDTTLIKQEQENSLAAQIDYSFRLFKGAISSSIFYEAGAGLEPKREFTYLKVASGQGIYTWIDYNSNGITEQNEFELASFQDQANYIRIFTPGTDYIKTYKNEYSQTVFINPEMVWKNKNGIRRVLSVFSDNLAYSINQKSTDELPEHSLNPFYTVNDSTLINLNQNLRNTFSFYRLNPKYGADYILQHNASKLLLSNGFDQKEKFSHGLKLRWNFFTDFTLLNHTEKGEKKYTSEYFPIKNYTVQFISNEIKIQYQPGFQTKVDISYTYSHQKNIRNTEISTNHNIGTEINYSFIRKGNILLKAQYLNITYNSQPETSIGYEMLQGLKPGHNATWSCIFQRKLANNIELNIMYNGRVSENIQVIHTGSMQIRAFF